MAALVIEHASKSFGETEVLRDVSLAVAAGEFCVHASGPSGCGKSTLLRAIAVPSGYSKRFGMVHVDFESQVRTPKDSAKLYSEIMRPQRAS